MTRGELTTNCDFAFVSNSIIWGSYGRTPRKDTVADAGEVYV